jgi:hypothetical protein
MKKILMTLIVAALLGGCAAQGSNMRFSDGDQPNILVMGEDADRDTVARDSRVFKRVLDTLADAMNDEGFRVYDEVAVTLDNFTQGRTRRSDAEIIDIARSVRSVPIDVAVIFSIYPTIQERDYGRKLFVRISGRLLNVRSGRRLSNFEVESPSASSLPDDCGRECELERVGAEARYLARDLGAVLARKLDYLVQTRRSENDDRRANDDDEYRSGLTTAYVLTFISFDNREINRIEDIITGFRGYEHLRTISSSLRTQEYWYESSSGTARLNRNLRLMLDDLRIRARLVYDGNEFSMEKY